MKKAATILTALLMQMLPSFAAVLYVSVSSTNPVSPYAEWSTAATNVQHALDVAQPGDLVLVTNGVYRSVGRLTADGTTNTVIATNPVILQSVNGPVVTIIDGGHTTRCVYLADGATLAGFTVMNGRAENGGGVQCASTNAVVTDCLLVNNAAVYGGGASSGTLRNCTVMGNSVGFAGFGGGAYQCVLKDCLLKGNTCHVNFGRGGGAASCILDNCTLDNNTTIGIGGGASGSLLIKCTLKGNSAQGTGVGGGAADSTLIECFVNENEGARGGGAAHCALTNCTLSYNRASYGGGGVMESTLYNCVLTFNYTPGGGPYGGGAWFSTLNNCTLYYNIGGGAATCVLNNSIIYYNTEVNNAGNILNFSCAPDAIGVGNITNAPLFINASGGDFRLQSYSPCVNAGSAEYVQTSQDRGGQPRVVGGAVDIGAYEEPSATDASGLPAIPSSLTAILQDGRVRLSWSLSSKAVGYALRRATSLEGPYTNIATGLSDTMHTDSTVTKGGVYFYLVAATNAYGESVVLQPAVTYVVDHFSWTLSGSLQTASVPFMVLIRACDSDGTVLTNFDGAAMLSAAGAHGPVPLEPAITASFSMGQWVGDVTIASSHPDTSMRLTARSNGVSGVSAPFDVIPPSIQRFRLTAADMIYDPFAKRIYATVPKNALTFADSLVVIDPEIGRIESSTYLGDDPDKLALSDNGRFLYVGFKGLNVFRRMDLATHMVDLNVDLGVDNWLFPYHAWDVAVLPGMPHSIALSRASPVDLAIVVYDDGVMRSNVLAMPSGGSWPVAAVAAISSTTLFTGGYCYKAELDDSGVARYEDHPGLVGFWDDLKYQRGKLCTSSGRVINPATAAVIGDLAPSYLTEPDLNRNRIYSLEGVTPPNGHPTEWTIHSYDASTLQPVDSLRVFGAIEGPASLIRWGTNGLALRSSNNQAFQLENEVLLIRSSLVPRGPTISRPLLTNAQRQASGAFYVELTGVTNAIYSMWASTNLIDWQFLGTPSRVNEGPLQFLDLEATNSVQRFYRAGVIE